MQVTSIQVIFLNGYEGWNVTRTKTKQISGNFDGDLCLEAFNSLEGENIPTLYDISGDDPVLVNNVLTCMGEEGGVVFVGS